VHSSSFCYNSWVSLYNCYNSNFDLIALVKSYQSSSKKKQNLIPGSAFIVYSKFSSITRVEKQF